ncbi:MAG TPA: alpha/beta hydrolase [Accumulibacter sp.]|uniref:alpha/beta fold hydrolase n=1 Tax=Accumulibacter sp. TaxID=2053492 RepID=UPI00262C408F|nr:alpha/beta hydrolase [Accumulibacter sp.]HNI00528.1 alpha/beta hydrolase [Rhodocyclaceae bacterium]HMV04676.1 alpha/beta hydrolase [Accumulibacter sp.]HMW63785.1 alpha/beta hydrolase [Accumulibacter sp.]HNC26012.1 alpha/beta hydrolase [Accumulibacter sp.]HND40133.1 alpha/beta hydrolase [Accumulibacter sp.]
MPQISANRIHIEYESFGSPAAPAVLLVMGLGAQLGRWPVELCQALVARGFRVIRFDNRDCGLSSKLDEAGVPDIARALRTGQAPQTAYTLDDMAADSVGLLDALEVERAHIVGASMGGAIAQIVAARYAARILSLTCIMTTSGHPELPAPTPEAARALFAPLPPARDKESLIEDAIRRQLAVASPDYPSCPQRLREQFTIEHERGFHPRGVTRQLAAFLASSDRRALLQTISVPTLVLHGALDPLIPVACGYDVAAHIPGARIRVIEGMAHDLPLALTDVFADEIAGLARASAP